MFLTFAATVLSLQAATLRVPYVPQTDALCGGAAAAMVFRYWGDAHADVEQFGALVERPAGAAAGIAAEVLTRAIASRGWRTDRATTSLDGLRQHLELRQPIIVLIADRADRRDLYHYVVVVGLDDEAVIVHDPSWGPNRAVKRSTFESLWSAAQYWSLVILPSQTRVAAASVDDPVAPVVEPAFESTDECAVLLNQTIQNVAAHGLDSADDLLLPIRQRCPESAGPYRELAGVRFAQKRWADAVSLARSALSLAPDDVYASEVLASSLFMLDDPEGALRAWNRIGKPRLDLVSIEGVRHARYQTITESLGLKPNVMLTADAFAKAKHRLNDLPDRSQSRLELQPQADGFATVDVAIAERSGRPRGAAAWTGIAVRAAVDRESSISLPGFTGQGEVWTASWRWYQNRPRVAIGFAAPRVGGLFGVWRVEGSWQAETYADGTDVRREAYKHAGVTVSDWMTGSLRYSLNAGLDVWEAGRRAVAAGGSLERRWLRDRLALAGDLTDWVPVDGGQTFTAAGIRAIARSSSNARGWICEGTVGADHVTRAAPRALWSGAGEGRARTTLLRAHPMLDDGIIDVTATQTAFGRSTQYANGEALRWFTWPSTPRMALAAFVDVARSAERTDGTSIVYADVGAGLRIRIPGVGKTLRVDFAHSLKDKAKAVTVGFTHQG
jgi:predicted double-glycine peptidase